MALKPYKKYALVLIALLLISGCTRDTSASLPQLLSETDDFISRGSLSQAKESLNQAEALTRGSASWLQVLKRAKSIAAATNDYEFLSRLSARAHEALPGFEGFAVLLVYADLRRGAYDRASSLARESITEERWQGLLDEIWLRRPGEASIGRRQASPFARAARAAEDKDPETLLRIASLIGDPRLRLDGALLLMSDGEPERAYRTLEGLADRYPEAYSYIAYDADELTSAREALRIYESEVGPLDPQTALFEADLYLRAGRYEAALEVYRNLLRSSPDHSWIPFVNGAKLLLLRGDGDQADTLIKNGESFFPGLPAFLMTRAEVQAALGNTAEAKRLLELYSDLHAWDLRAIRLSIELVGEEISRDRLQFLLWQAFWSNPGQSDLANYVSNFFLQLRDFQGLSQLLDEYERADGEKAWTRFYRGLVALGEKSYQKALEEFLQSLELAVAIESSTEGSSPDGRWNFLYNIALVNLALGKYEESGEYLRRAEAIILKNLGSATKIQALIRYRIGQVLAATGSRDAAVRELSFALDLDSSLVEARLLRRELEESLR